MWKKLMTSLVVMIIILFISTVGFAASTNNTRPRFDKVDITKYQVITPENDSSATTKKVVLISGKAPEGTSIVIDVYGAIDLTGKNYSLTKLPDKDAYTHISTKTIKSGAVGFGEEIELILGINKIIITFDVNEVPSVEKILYCYEVAQAVDNLRSLPISPTIK
ncbi:hypothetical protein [Clostridium sp. Cult2]|uniref:hypothetical protein n=1 Tax=Clostridium sp. Cult2 TaxID=2079003 RepID=UPI001F353E45|nr:hypothetical protein [Clostridium sp. Cult2]MCF6464432.1 hypothetical protein [Clostridium sp. Cult2]